MFPAQRVHCPVSWPTELRQVQDEATFSQLLYQEVATNWISPWSESVCILSVSEARQADVRIWLFCVTVGTVCSFFLTISVPPDKPQTCTIRKQVARGRGMILIPLLRSVRAALPVSYEWGTGKTFPLAFYFQAVLSICFCILCLKWAGH